MIARRLMGALIGVVAFATAAQAGCAPLIHAYESFTVCRFDPGKQPLALFNVSPEGEPIGTFTALARRLANDGKQLTFAMNAGMFDEKLRPIGLYVENGELLKKLNRRGGYGNFHLKPNGVFWLEGGKAGVSETEAYAKSGRKPEFATQSGPMLVINGKLHPKFSEAGTSSKVRNGVGVTEEGEVIFVLSEGPVNFYRFAVLFRDVLETPNALFLDGSLSGLYSTELGRNDGFLPFGPMVGAWEMQ